MELKELLHTTSRYVNILKENKILTLKDFFDNFPRAYEDRSQIKPLNELVFDEKWKTVTKWVVIAKKQRFANGKKMFEVKFQDEKWNVAYISIFNSAFLASKLIVWERYIIVGKPVLKFGKLTFGMPDVVPTLSSWGEAEKYNEKDITESLDSSLQALPFVQNDNKSGRIFPIYSELQGIKPWWFAQKMRENLDKIPEYFSEYLPDEFLRKFGLLDVQKTMKNMHYPDSRELRDKALYRVFFDRLLRIQLYSLQNRLEYQWTLDTPPLSETPHWEVIKPFLNQLSFSLTVAQKKVLVQILEDFYRGKPMVRLLQWDVWSGKTIVAATAMYYTWKIWQGQSVLLAPLEVLAVQHYKTLAKYLLPLGVRVELLTWSMTKSKKEEIKNWLKSGKIHVVVSTHAILQDWIDFDDLKFVCIDEQHKFGVKQRAVFKKFNNPHILQMTATPIPRSMALAFFGEFDVSVIDELPAGRVPIDTKVISESEYLKLKPWVLQKIGLGQKVFVVTPLIEDSEKMDEVKSVKTQYEEIVGMFPELREEKIWLLHGKMKSSEKDDVMNDFKSGKISILVSTTVIEVWVDIPEATIMVIKNSERFWLSQLHQLRWRIGRSNLQSYCFLETPKKSWDTFQRLKIMETTRDGFKLAELDMKNRWSGQILGTMQSGESDIPLEILSDLRFLERVQEGAIWLLKKYPKLEWLPWLKHFMREKIGDVLA